MKTHRNKIFKHILVPEDLAIELLRYKKAYAIYYSTDSQPVRVTFEDMFRRWMKNVGRFDPAVKHKYQELLTEKIAAPLPSPSPEKKIWLRPYYFVKGQDRVEAVVGDIIPFVAKLHGRNVSAKEMGLNGWTLVDENGQILTDGEAISIFEARKEYIAECIRQYDSHG